MGQLSNLVETENVPKGSSLAQAYKLQLDALLVTAIGKSDCRYLDNNLRVAAHLPVWSGDFGNEEKGTAAEFSSLLAKSYALRLEHTSVQDFVAHIGAQMARETR